ncbi:MAG TPA: NADH-ubiquinone oxidoreductase-F iron-sulfur binding region domain-containing protein [Acidimicrobiales bacterium]|nr:NADH-ubiquinone oxidoreductase-F iron-sulfur binding region domain-containing protein [Acidimicrobiales bacterium]
MTADSDDVAPSADRKPRTALPDARRPRDPRRPTAPRGFLLPPAPIASLDEYLATETGGLGLRRAQDLGPAATIDAIDRSGLRGRGGAGFPTGRKWSTIAAQPGSDRYLVVNGAEGEPGTFKDRALMRSNPYQLVEGTIIAAYAVDAVQAYIALKASFQRERAAVLRAITEMQEAGICRDCRITLVAGPDEYLFGEEKALLEVIEGNEPLPRVLPPYEHGLFARAPQAGWQATEVSGSSTASSNPTLVNNVETLSNVPHILVRGAEWFRAMGTPLSPGNVVATVVGDVRWPAVGEVELGTPLRDVIETIGGGAQPGRSVKAVFTGVANAVVTADDLDAPFSYEGLQSAGSGLGAAGLIVYDDSACMVEAARQVSRFLAVESCGQCPPCKLGAGEITQRLEHIERGDGTPHDVDEIVAWLAKVTDGSRCFLATQERNVVASVLRAFGDEVSAHLAGACPRPRDLPLPLLVDLADGVAQYDDRHRRKRPDWTYASA